MQCTYQRMISVVCIVHCACSFAFQVGQQVMFDVKTTEPVDVVIYQVKASLSVPSETSNIA